jgi:hypothetical protein
VAVAAFGFAVSEFFNVQADTVVTQPSVQVEESAS